MFVVKEQGNINHDVNKITLTKLLRKNMSRQQI